MSPATLWDTLRAGHERLLSASSDHLQLCASATPDAAGLTSARWRVAQAGRGRMTTLTESVLPALEARCGPDDIASRQRFRETPGVYRRHISAYVKRWPIETIVADWADYRRAAEHFRSEIVDRIALETALLKPMLNRLGRRPAA